MAYNLEDKSPGDLIKSDDWNDTMDRIKNKVSKNGAESMTGPLSIETRLGIGTSPLRELHIHESSGNCNARISTGSGYANGILEFYEGSTRQASLIVRGSQIAGGPPNALNIYTSIEGAPITLGTAGGEKIRIKDNGNVGIGTSRPDTKLEVNGKIKCQNVREQVMATDTISISTNAWVDMKDMIINAKTAENPVLVIFNAATLTAREDSTFAIFRLMIDDKPKAFSHHCLNSYKPSQDVTLTWMGVLSAGFHTFKVQWVEENGKEVKVCHWGYEPHWGERSSRHLIVIEL